MWLLQVLDDLTLLVWIADVDLVDAVLGGLVSIETRRLASYWNGFMDLLFTSSVCLMTCVIDTHVDRSDFFWWPLHR